MKRTLIILPVLLALIGSGIYFYFHWQYASLSKWSFVPSSSIMVFQPTNWPKLLSSDEERKILVNLKSLPELNEIAASLDSLDSLIEGGFNIEKIIEPNDLLISVHQGANASLANLYILEVSGLKQHDFLAKGVKYLTEVEGFKASTRLYEGYTISEYKKGDVQLAYIFYRNYLILSFSPFLVDDAIRTLVNDKENPYTKNIALESTSQQVVTGEGRLYINMKELNRLVQHFVNPTDIDGSNLKWLTDLMYLDLNVSDEDIDFAGFSYLDTANINYLSSFIGVKGTGFEMKNVVPDHSSLVIHMSFEDVTQWHNGLKNFWRKHKPSQLTRIGEIENKYGFDVKKFYDFVGDEIGLFVLESKRNLDREKIFCIRHKDQIRAENYLEELAKGSNPDTAFYHQTYANRVIGEILLDELPGRLFGDPFSGFPTSYYYVSRDFIFIGNTQHALEVLIDDIDMENTWRKSVRTNSFLESTNDDANLSVYIKSSGMWGLMANTLNDKWGQYIEDNKSVLKQIEYGVMQFTGVDNKFYTNVAIQHPGHLIESQKPQEYELMALIGFDKPLISKPFAVRNHNDKTLEFMIQDSTFHLSLISVANQVVLDIPLTEQITSPIYQVDYYKNGKLQYLFSTSHEVHIIDRTGTYIPDYPQKIKTSEKIEFLSLIDYDNSKNYRIMVATQKGYYYLTDKAGKILEGWDPVKLKGEPVMAGRHLRVQTLDYMIFLQNDGLAYGLNRTGTPKDGFPLDLKSPISSPLHIQKGASPKTTELAAMTNNGELIVFNLLGDVIRKGQLRKEDPTENYQLVSSNDGDNFVVVRNKKGSIEFYGEDLELLFSINSPGEQLMYQYYAFGEDNRIVIVIDPTKKEALIYHLDGRLLNSRPIKTGEKMAVMYHESNGQYELFVSAIDTYKRLKLKR
ncbi:hypothetical protein N6H18_09580 [Reichenbachiella agarivorans]|uniref:Uncharacterized protein n=1 Tax=Reichenbachiella agarivorans TaxID=2979464 RepID=A0ABY6CJN6_9BACT|nr:hypothetical protein [Reichenbachiella agarivorans]UXP30604.1 hypothetical protein N6H18_09580 [Reichenbachiella agarivorans]